MPIQQYTIFDTMFEDPSRNDFSIDKANDASGERNNSVIPKTYPKYSTLSKFNSEVIVLNTVLKRECAYNNNIIDM
jgi:hypothetical protein